MIGHETGRRVEERGRRRGTGRRDLAHALLMLALVTVTARAQEGFSFPPGSTPRLYEPGFTSEADYDKLLIGATYWYDFERCTPATPCQDAGGNLLPHVANGHLQVGTGGDWWAGAYSPWETWGPCSSCTTVQADWIDADEDPTFEVKSHWAPGERDLRLTMQTDGSSESVYSDARTVRFVYPGVVDLGVKKFDVLAEKDLCLGSAFTSRFKVFNWGELDATDALVEIWVADDKAMSVNAQKVTSFPVPVTIPAGESAGLTFEHTDELPGFAKGLRYFAARVLWNPLDQDPPPQGQVASKQSPPDKVSVLADFRFTGKGLHWGTPSGSPAKVFPGQVCTLHWTGKNVGRVDTEAHSVILVQMKKAYQPWSTVAQVPVPDPISCHSGEVVSGTIELTLPVDDPQSPEYHDYVEIGKSRGVRLVFLNGGLAAGQVDEPAVPETKTKNNRSKVKTVKFVPSPSVAKVVRQASDEWIPNGRWPTDEPGTPGALPFELRVEEVSDGPARPIRFVLQSSAEPGVCLNLGAEFEGGAPDPEYLAPDLRIVVGQGSGNEDLGPVVEEPGPAPYGTQWVVETQSAVKQTLVVVQCHDWGAYGRIRAIALDELGQEIGEGTDWIDVPRDDNGNHIADACEDVPEWADLDTSPGAGGLDDSDPLYDQEIEAWLPGLFPGDGLTRYEEYRGFVHRGSLAAGQQHVETYSRLSPTVREFFVFRFYDQYGLGALESLLTVVDVTADQINGWETFDNAFQPIVQGTQRPSETPKTVNFNHGSHHLQAPGQGQHASVLFVHDDPAVNDAEPKYGYYVAKTGTIADTQPGLDTPGDTAYANVFEYKLRDLMSGPDPGDPTQGTLFNWDGYLGGVGAAHLAERDYYITHELLHTVGGSHHPDEASHPDFVLDVEDYPGADPQQPAFFDYEGNVPYTGPYLRENCMGVIDCFMRYHSVQFAAALAGDSDLNGIPLDGADVLDPDLDPGLPLVRPSGLCSAAAGPQPLYGTIVHDCLGKIRIKDAAP